MTEPYPSYPGQEPTGGQTPPSGPAAPVASARPGAVSAASVITIVLSVLSIVGGIMFAAASGPVADYVRDHPETLEDFSASDRQNVLDNLSAALVSLGVVTIIIGVVGLLLGVLVRKPRGWARVLLAIAAVLTLLLSLPFSLSLIGLPWLIGSIVVLVLLFNGKSSDWFAGRPIRA